MSDNLPPNWAFAALADLGTLVGGGTPSKANPAFWIDGTIPWVSPKDFRVDVVNDAQDHITEDAVASSATNIIPAGAVLVVTRSGILINTLPVAVTGTAVAINQDVRALIPSSGISADYIAHALRRFSAQILRDCTKSGTTVPSILTPRLQAFRIPVAPLPEQTRIVSCVNTVLSRSANARQAISTMPAQLARYRIAVLDAAFRGDATRTWRDRRDDETDVQSLIDAIVAARLTEGRSVIDVSERGSAAFHLRPNVPWHFLTLDSVCDPKRGISYGIIQTGDDTEGGVPTVRAGDIKNFAVEPRALKKVRPDTSDRYPRTLLRGGEVLVSIRGTTGNVAVVSPHMVGMNVSREVAVIPLLSGVEPRFVAYALASPAGQAIISGHVKGVAQAGINLADLRDFPLPVSSRAEQREIISFVDGALGRLDGLRGRAEDLDRQLGELAAAALRKAFRGDLTPQNPNDEPAATLIQRSRAAQSAAAAQPRPRTTRPVQGQGDLFRRLAVPQTRKDVETDHLRSVISRAGIRSLPAKELYLRSDMDIDEFYKQLALEVALGLLRQSADKTRMELADAT